MRLLVGIHLGKIHEVRQFSGFLKQQRREDPHTFLVSFHWPGFPMEKMGKLLKDSGISPSNVLPVRANTGDGWATVFEPYKEGFAKAIETALQNAWARERVDVVLFGGTAKGCFDRMGWEALRVLTAKLGDRLGRVETAAQWVYKYGGKRVLPLARRRVVPNARRQTRRSKK